MNRTADAINAEVPSAYAPPLADPPQSNPFGPALVERIDSGHRDYIRGGRGPRYKWWKPIIALIIALPLVFFLRYGMNYGLGRLSVVLYPSDHETIMSLINGGNVLLHPIVLLLTFSSFVSLFLSLALVVRFIEGRKFGTLNSIKGRMRWGLLGRAFALATLFWLPFHLFSFQEGRPMADLTLFIPQIIILLLLVPIQSSVEEYLCRGWIQQTLGSWKAPAWLALIISTVLFTILHPQYGPMGLTFVGTMGLCMGWLAIRTGGLEAAIALHVVNNYLSFGSDLIWQDNPFSESGSTWEGLAFSVVRILLFTAIADFWFRRVIIKREGRQVMSGAFGGPVGDFGQKPAVVTNGTGLSVAPGAPSRWVPLNEGNANAVHSNESVQSQPSLVSTGHTHYEHGPRAPEAVGSSS
ncbi:MAG: type II CAAX endopeptidase family protein [Actinomycetaceae bacterium]|nr:type II CAAX endopeptidase family protein [Actinomycetaceae bacterium]